MKLLIKISIGLLFVGIIIIATDFIFLWLPLDHSSEYPTKVAALFMALTALVTLLLALVTVKATEQSNLREMNRRTDNLEKENRDRKDIWLNEILAWGQDVQEIISEDEPDAISLTEGSLITLLHNTCVNLHSRVKHLEIMSEVFGETLKGAITNTGSKLNSCKKVSSNLVGRSDIKPGNQELLQFIKLAVDTDKSADKIIELCGEQKILLLHQSGIKTK